MSSDDDDEKLLAEAGIDPEDPMASYYLKGLKKGKNKKRKSKDSSDSKDDSRKKEDQVYNFVVNYYSRFAIDILASYITTE